MGTGLSTTAIGSSGIAIREIQHVEFFYANATAAARSDFQSRPADSLIF
jgi:hypothetical protein